MLRACFYATSIITLRLIMVLAAVIISSRSGCYVAMPCRKIAFVEGKVSVYPTCQADPDAYAAVKAEFLEPDGAIDINALNMSFGMGVLLVLGLHAVGVEVYLRLKPPEAATLRHVSYERQLERGFSHAGSAGLTVD